MGGAGRRQTEIERNRDVSIHGCVTCGDWGRQWVLYSVALFFLPWDQVSHWTWRSLVLTGLATNESQRFSEGLDIPQLALCCSNLWPLWVGVAGVHASFDVYAEDLNSGPQAERASTLPSELSPRPSELWKAEQPEGNTAQYKPIARCRCSGSLYSSWACFLLLSQVWRSLEIPDVSSSLRK